MEVWLIIIITLLLSAFFSGMEIAYISSNKLKIELDNSNRRLSGTIISSFAKNPSKTIATILIGNNISLVAYGLAMAALLQNLFVKYFPDVFNNDTFILIFQTLISTIIILIFGEFIPKTLFRLKPNSILNFFAFPLLFIYWLLLPLVYLFVGLSEFFLKNIFKENLKKQDYIFSPVDLEHFVKEFSGEITDENTEEEILMFQNAINLKKTKLRECMIPRTEITAIEENEAINDLKKLYTKSGHSNILVYSNSIDNIIGHVHAYDMFKNPEKIKDYLKPVLYLPETMASGKALTKLIRQNKKLAVVVDEFGGTSGIVTIEDIIEEFVGEINDEFDIETLIEKQISNTEYVLSARLEIDYLNGKYHLGLPVSDEYETIAGLILQYHQSIPKQGDEITIKNFKLRILQATKTKVEKILLKFE